MKNNIIKIGNYVQTGAWSDQQRGRIYSVKGICPTLSARDYKDPSKILVRRINSESR